MAKLTHKVLVVPVELTPHPNADTLSIVKVFHKYTVCVKTELWKGIDKAAYIPPDSVVPMLPQYDFLRERDSEGNLLPWKYSNRRITARRLRGVVSYGMLVPAPPSAQIGQDVAKELEIEHYEPKINISSDPQCFYPPIVYRSSEYDVESWHTLGDMFSPDEDVIVTEKLHGANSRFVFAHNSRAKGHRSIFGIKIPRIFTHGMSMNAASRTRWVSLTDDNLWAQCLRQNPWIEELCRKNPEKHFYGEVFGPVQSLKYGTEQGGENANKILFKIFDIWHNGYWLSFHETEQTVTSEHLVPKIIRCKYSKIEDKLESLASGKTLIPGANHIREGIVIRSMNEEYSELGHRKILKIINPDFLMQK